MDNKPTVLKESKNKIRVEFERTSLKKRLKSKFLTMTFAGKVMWYIFRLLLLIGIAFVVVQPFITMILRSFMDAQDFGAADIVNIPKHFSLDIYKAIFKDLSYIKVFFSTLGLSLGTALIQTFVCCLVGYGLAKFKFRGAKLVFGAVVLTMVIPHGTLQSAIYYNFRYFDILGFFKFWSGGFQTNISWLGWLDNIFSKIKILPWPEGINLLNTVVPLFILSLCGLALKNGLYVFMLRQFFRGVPDELEESAYLDGASTFRTFIQVILPISIPMMITVFLFAFCWQWTDDFYLPLLFIERQPYMTYLTQVRPASIAAEFGSLPGGNLAIMYACGLLICLPLAILYLFCQKYLVQGIERSGIVG